MNLVYPSVRGASENVVRFITMDGGATTAKTLPHDVEMWDGDTQAKLKREDEVLGGKIEFVCSCGGACCKPSSCATSPALQRIQAGKLRLCLKAIWEEG